MYKKIASTIIVATLLVSLILSLGTVAVTKAQAVQSITLSASYLHTKSVLEIIVYAPGYEEDYIKLKVKNADTGEEVTLDLVNATGSTVSGDFYAYKYATGYYVAYLFGNETNLSSGDFPKYPKATNATVGVGSNYAMMPDGTEFGEDYVVYVPGTDVEETFTYGYVTFELSLDRSPAEYPPKGFIELTMVDQDFNLDPTAINSIDPAEIKIDNITVQRTSTGEYFYLKTNTTVYYSLDNVTSVDFIKANETKINSATFTFELNVSKIAELLNNTYYGNLPSPEFKDGDLVEITLIDPQKTTKKVSVEFTVKSVTPTISLTAFDFSSEITIQVEWFDANVKSWEEDTIEANVFNITLWDADLTTCYDNETVELEETDVNTGVFEEDLDLTWTTGTEGEDSNGAIEVPLDVAKEGKSFVLKVSSSDLEVERYFDLTLHAPTLSTDKAEYTKDETVVVTLVDPDLNDDASLVEAYRVTSGELKKAKAEKDGVTFFNVTLYDKTKGKYVTYNDDVVFIETGKDTGIFEAELSFDKMDGVEEGDTLELTIKDYTSGESVSVEFKLVKVTRAIELDRTTYPVPRYSDESVLVHIKFTAPDKNDDPHIRDDAKVNVTITYYNGSKVTKPLTLRETDVNTGVFEGTYEVSLNDTALINGKIRVWYDADGSGAFESDKDVYAEATFRVTTASMSVTPLSVNYGGEVTVTVYDPDANLDSESKDTITVSYDDETLELEETEANSGIFNGTFVIGKDITGFEPGDTITFTYTDEATSASVPGGSWSEIDIEVNVKIKTNTGVLALDKTEYGPGAKMKITLTEPDLNVNLDDEDSADVTVKIEGIETKTVTLTETGINTGVFEKTYRLPSGANAIGKKVLVAYKDEADATGAAVTITVEAIIRSWDPEVSFDKDYYKIGEIAKITIVDPDQNTDPEGVDSLNITVYTDSDPLGLPLSAYETDVNTGVFEAYVLISDSFGTDRVYAKYGDKVYVEYEDEYPADYAVTEESKTFTATATVGIPVEKPFEIATPSVVDPTTGAEVTETTVGKMVAISTAIENIDVVERTFAYVVQVKDAAGVVVYLSYIEGTVPAGYSFTPTISWTPTAPGVYTVEVFVWKSVAEPTAYSPVLTLTITVSELSLIHI